ncbi:Ankyrin repeat and SOCS box 3-like protein [Cladobotryum mycophilum]|uniref:Ankyrin repeat and SOCS box 3-like protein n=1 Tax=Cladobotryum mycophilum TaxID=491253 RepID=A0ABR0SIN1_9HYPO
MSLVTEAGEGNSPIGEVILHRFYLQIAELLKQEVSVEFYRKKYYRQKPCRISPLFLAAWRGHTEVARLLLEYGADNNFECKFKRPSRESYGWCPPLILAVENGRVELTKMLLEYGADPNGAYHALSDTMWLEEPKWENSTPLVAAILWNHQAIFELLLETSGILINNRDVFYRTPYYWAVLRRNRLATSMLQVRGGNLLGEERKGD